MTTTHFKRQQKRHGLTNAQAAKIFGVSIRTIANWRAGVFPVPKLVAEKLK